MASRSRLSGASTAAARRPVTIDAPAYEPPAHPLNPRAKVLLQSLRQTHDLSGLKTHLRNANAGVTTMAGDVNDRLLQREEREAKKQARKARQRSKGAEPDDEDDNGEAELEQMRTRVEKMTQRMDDSTRKTIDGQNYVESLEHVLANLPQAANGQCGTQRRNRRGGDDEEEEEEEEEEEDDEELAATIPGATNSQSQRDVVAPTTLFKSAMDREVNRYQSQSHAYRYAQHNDYIGFRRIVHDAQNPGDDAPPLPDASTWFQEEGDAAPGMTSQAALRRNNSGEGDDSDDDIVISRANISTKCPLTLQEFKDPVTSTKCPHSFERNAIVDLIRESGALVGGSNRRGVRDGERAAQCPVPGCEKMLTTNDVATDPLLVRRIRRLQQSRRDMGSDDEGDEEGGEPHDTMLLDASSEGE